MAHRGLCASCRGHVPTLIGGAPRGNAGELIVFVRGCKVAGCSFTERHPAHRQRRLSDSPCTWLSARGSAISSGRGSPTGWSASNRPRQVDTSSEHRAQGAIHARRQYSDVRGCAGTSPRSKPTAAASSGDSSSRKFHIERRHILYGQSSGFDSLRTWLSSCSVRGAIKGSHFNAQRPRAPPRFRAPNRSSSPRPQAPGRHR